MNQVLKEIWSQLIDTVRIENLTTVKIRKDFLSVWVTSAEILPVHVSLDSDRILIETSQQPKKIIYLAHPEYLEECKKEILRLLRERIAFKINVLKEKAELLVEHLG